MLNLTPRRHYYFYFIIGVNLIFFVMLPLISFAQTTTPSPLPLQILPQTPQIQTPENSENNEDNLEPEPVATTTTPISTTTPVSHTDIPEPDPIYREQLEDILNQTITPTKPLTEPEKKPVTPIRVKPDKKPDTSSTTTSGTVEPRDDSSNANTTIPFERSTNGEANQFTPSNYYFPLDRLSPEVTYGLITASMVIGVIGAVLIVREPDIEVVPVWRPQWSESLLES